MSQQLVGQFKDARLVSTPIIAIGTPDPAATVSALCAGTNGAPKLQWDVVRGVQPINDAGIAAKAAMNIEYDLDPVGVVVAADLLPADAILFMHNAGKFLENPAYVQAIWNLRDQFKSKRRTLVLLASSWTLPPELAGDVLVLDEPLPDAAQLAQIVRDLHKDAKLPIADEAVELAVEAVQGLAAFPAEQATAMCIKKGGLDVAALWERKRQMIEQTPGLKVSRSGERYSDVGGVEVIKGFLSRISQGLARPNAIVFIDEIEKAMAGQGDTSGVSQDQLGCLLSYMQDTNAVGVLFVGPPGSAKSLIAKSTGNEAGIPTIQLDLGAAKGSLVGQSEQQLRNALKVVSSVSNGRSLWIATCNSLNSLPPELRRRFSLGVFYFDLPSAEERESIWSIWTAKYKLAQQTRPDDEGWTGAEIKTCCDIAWRMGCSLVEAANFVVPVSKSAADQIEKLRSLAEGRFLSASAPGVYHRQRGGATAANGKAAKSGRQISIAE